MSRLKNFAKWLAVVVVILVAAQGVYSWRDSRMEQDFAGCNIQSADRATVEAASQIRLTATPMMRSWRVKIFLWIIACGCAGTRSVRQGFSSTVAARPGWIIAIPYGELLDSCSNRSR